MKPKIFISYSRKDSAYAELLSDLLQEKGYDTWTWAAWTDKKVNIGENWREVIESQLKNANVVVSLVSSDYFNSEFSLIELGAAYGLGKKIVPILLSGNANDIPFVFKKFRMLDAQKMDKNALLKLIEQQVEKGLAA